MVDRVFRLLEEEERTNIKLLLASKPPKVVFGYPRSAMTGPVIAIAIGNEQGTTDWLNDDLPDDIDDPYDESETGVQEVFGHRVSTTLQVFVLALNPDHVQYIYQMVWGILLAMTKPLVALQFTPTDSMSGGDIQPREDLMPEVIFARVITRSWEGTRSYVTDAGLWTDVVVSAEVSV